MFYNYRFFPLQIIVIKSRERCIHNVSTSLQVQYYNHIFYNFQFFTPKHSHIVTGTVYTDFVYIFPGAKLEPGFP